MHLYSDGWWNYINIFPEEYMEHLSHFSPTAGVKLLLLASLQFLLHGVIPLRAAHAGRTLGQGRVAPPLLGSLRLNSQCVNTVAQLVLQCLVHQTVALDQRQTVKLGADHQDAEVGLRAGRYGVHVAFIVDLQVFRFKGVGQFGPDGLFNGPA